MSDYKPLTPEWLHDLIQINFGREARPDEIVNLLDQRQAWPEEFLARAEYKAKIEIIRQLIRKIVDDDGHRIYHNIPQLNEHGVLQPMYVNEELFDESMYEAAIDSYYRGIAQYRFHADHLRKTYYRRYGIWYPTYEEWSNGGEG